MTDRHRLSELANKILKKAVTDSGRGPTLDAFLRAQLGLTTGELAEIYHASAGTVRRWIRTQGLPSHYESGGYIFFGPEVADWQCARDARGLKPKSVPPLRRRGSSRKAA